MRAPLPLLTATLGCAHGSADRPSPPAEEAVTEASEPMVPAVALDARPDLPRLRLGEARLTVDRQGVLRREEREGTVAVLDSAVVGRPVVSPHRVDSTARVAWASAADGALRLRVLEETSERVVERALPGPLAPLAWLDERTLALVGSAEGGVAGLWLATELDDAPEFVCLTNCALRAGRPWDDDFVPPPASGDRLERRGATLHYVDAEGASHEVPLPEAER